MTGSAVVETPVACTTDVKFFHGESTQALAFAVAALQAMPSTPVVAEVAAVESPRTTLVVSTSSATIMSAGSMDNIDMSDEEVTPGQLPRSKEESSMVTPFQQSAGSGSNSKETASSATVVANVVASTTRSVSIEVIPAPAATAAAVVRVEPEDTDDATSRLQRSRERNREHARRTRLRKKAQLQALQAKYQVLLAEKQVLLQQQQDRSIASILLGLSSPGNDDDDCNTPPLDGNDESRMSLWPPQRENNNNNNKNEVVVSARRKRGAPEVSNSAAPLTLAIDGIPTAISCKSHINWKSGMYSDDQGRQKQLTVEQLETLRRERNRMHAKMTRDRKKCFISTMEKAIEELEEEIQRMRSDKVVVAVAPDEQTSSSTTTTTVMEVMNMITPELTALPSPDDAGSCASSAFAQPVPSPKRVCHGFSLDG